MDSFRDTYKSIIHVGLKLVTDMLRPRGAGVSDDDYDIRLLSFFFYFSHRIIVGKCTYIPTTYKGTFIYING